MLSGHEIERALFETIDEGFCVCQMLVDADGRAVDYRFLEVNPNFERHTGLKNAPGRTALELVPNLEPHWIQTYGKVALSGEPVRFVQGSDAMGRWFDVYAFRVGEPGNRTFGILFTDISDRKRAEDRLREREERFRVLANSAPVLIWVTDEHNQAEFMNEEYLKFLGRPMDTLIGGGWTESLHPDDAAGYYGSFVEAAGRRARFEADFRFRRADGEYRWMRTVGVPRFEGGVYKGYVGSTSDIHERKESEQALRRSEAMLAARAEALARLNDALLESEARFRNMADHAPVMIWVTDPDGSCTYLSRRWYDFTGQTPETALGFRWLDATHPDDRRNVEWMFVSANRKREPFHVDYRLRRHDGVYRWAIDSAAPRFGPGGEYLGYIGSVIDITERKQRELNAEFVAAISQELARLSASDDIMRLVAAGVGQHLDGSRCLFAEIDSASGRVAVAHDWRAEGHASMAGSYSLSEFVTPALMAQLSAGTQLVVNDTAADVRLAEVAARFAELRIGAFVSTPHLSDGVWRGSLTIQSARPREWTPEQLELLREISNRAWTRIERARAEQRLRESEAELRQASRMKDEFLATLSHELRTPLNAVLGWSHMLRTGTLRGEMAQRAFDSIERNARAQTQLVDDLLDMSRIISGKLQIRSEIFDLEPAIDGAVDTVRPAAAAKGLALDVRTAEERRIQVNGDPDRIRQIVWNLLSNAIKFTPSGGRIDVALARAGEAEVEIVVRDSGEGIDPEFLPFVFDRFRQADGTTTRRYGGLGLGLAIVRHLTEAHGGTVGVESEGRHRGSTFRVRLPIASERARTDPQEPPDLGAGRAALQGVSVLIVDDDPDARDLLRIVLEREGAHVAAAASMAEALRTLQERRFDVLLADIGMPEQDGFALIRHVRGSGGVNAQVPAIAVTAYASLRERELALEAGYDRHVAKPVEPEHVVAVVEAAAGPAAGKAEPFRR